MITVLNVRTRPITSETVSSFRADLQKRDPRLLETLVKIENVRYLTTVGEKYRREGWKWNRGAKYLFRCLIQSLDLQGHETFILQEVKPKRGRKSNTNLAERILWETAQGKNSQRDRRHAEG